MEPAVCALKSGDDGMSSPQPLVVSAGTPGARGLVSRRGLFNVLDRALLGRVTVVSAPPGSGKTFLFALDPARRRYQRLTCQWKTR
jgi:ATP/maltotriose-dependent transcriptional regulator MalT